MSNTRIIAVVGATGAQGGGLARAILADAAGGFTLRALTRKPDGDAAKALAAAGAEVVAADLDDEASLRRAFEGAHGVYCVTNFWEHFSPDREMAQAKAMAQAAKAAGVQHAIWSTLEDSRRFVPLSDERMPTLMGRYKVPHFDAKGESDHFFADTGVPTSFLLTSFYWENLIFFGMGPKPGAGGGLEWTMPLGTARFPGIGVEDIGRSAYGIFKRGADLVGKRVGIAGEHLTGAEMAAALGDVLGQPVRYNAITPAQFRGFGFPGAEDLGNMFQFNTEFAADFCRVRDLAATRALNPALQTFRQWLAANKARIPLS
ncbi:MAG: NmrA family NAD(P)-binding protein [Rhizobacter sp.]|nr:NmrA family NAD(P)-binding protein [Rhizobacter sp.]